MRSCKKSQQSIYPFSTAPSAYWVIDFDLRQHTFRAQLGHTQFQLCLFHRDLKDELVIRLHAQGKIDDQTILQAIYRARPMLSEGVDKGIIHAAKIEWIAREKFQVNARTGKHRRILDLRK